jgi:hypothetical protein
MLIDLKMKGLGPGPIFSADLAPRLNLLTGDNGLGKSFFLDVAWWAMTGTWPNKAAVPLPDRRGLPTIAATFQTAGSGHREKAVHLTSQFSFSDQNWLRPRKHLLASSLLVYARVDGGYSVFDSARRFPVAKPPGQYEETSPGDPTTTTPAIHLTKEQLWDGWKVGGEFPCEGLVRDWVRWQREDPSNGDGPFRNLSRVVEQLAPHPKEWIRIGQPQRITPNDSRDIPTIELPYGATPVTLAAEGMKRILALAYILVWTWQEHQQAAKLMRRRPAKELVLLVDEVEAHLHPRWQRTILPALMNVASELTTTLRMQCLITTHAPLVLASVEPVFDTAIDRLFLFEQKNGARPHAVLNRVRWSPQGDAVGWLTSEIFGLKQARSREA